MNGFGNPAAVAANGTLLTGSGTSVDSSVQAIKGAVGALVDDAGWTGAAASRFTTVWDADAVDAGTTSTAFSEAGAALTTLATTLATCQEKADTRAAQAQREGAPLTADGTLAYQPTTPDEAAAYNRYVEDVNQYLEQATSARRTAQETLQRALTSLLTVRRSRAAGPDPQLAAALDAAEANGDYSAVNAALRKMTPAQVAAFIASLSTAEQQALARNDPHGVGNLDGVPLPLRATADHILVQQDLAHARATGDTHRITVDTDLLKHGGSVILFDPAADHYGVLYGDITKATHVAVFVPGVGNDSNLGGWEGNAMRLQQQSPGSAVILWKGYDDPGDHGTLDIANAGLDGRAEAGATGLTRFSDGLGLTNGQTYTVVAHSYGTVVAGQALAHDGLHPTNAVFLGSPGTVVDSASDLHLAPGHFYDEKAPGDYVANALGGFGVDPSSPDFGGIRLATNADGLPDVSGHSQYFDANSQALTGISDVVENRVPASDIQSATLGDDVRNPASQVASNVLFPGHGVLDELTHHYDGPGSGVLQGVDHIETGTGKLVGTGLGSAVDTVTGTVSTGGSIIYHVLGF